MYTCLIWVQVGLLFLKIKGSFTTNTHTHAPHMHTHTESRWPSFQVGLHAPPPSLSHTHAHTHTHIYAHTLSLVTHTHTHTYAHSLSLSSECFPLSLHWQEYQQTLTSCVCVWVCVWWGVSERVCACRHICTYAILHTLSWQTGEERADRVGAKSEGGGTFDYDTVFDFSSTPWASVHADAGVIWSWCRIWQTHSTHMNESWYTYQSVSVSVSVSVSESESASLRMVVWFDLGAVLQRHTAHIWMWHGTHTDESRENVKGLQFFFSCFVSFFVSWLVRTNRHFGLFYFFFKPRVHTGTGTGKGTLCVMCCSVLQML